MLKTTVLDGTKKLRFQQEITKTGAMDTDISLLDIFDGLLLIT